MTDVTVLGGGIFGLAVAWACTRRGARVRLNEARRIGAGASGGITGALFPHVPENWNLKKQFQLDSLLMAQDWWAEIARASGRDPGYARVGRVQPLADAEAVVRAREHAAGAAENWRGAASWELRESVPGLRVESPAGAVVHDTLSARLHPRRACTALALALREAGAVLCEEGTGSLRGAVVWATGWEGLAALHGKGGRPVGVGVKGQAMLLAHDAGPAPLVHAGDLYLVPQADGTLALGGTSEREFTAPTGTDARLDDLHTRAVALCPEISGAQVIERWAGVRPRARSRAPMLGPWPGRPGHYIANGGFKIGFAVAPMVGEVMADLVLEGRDTIPPGFRVEDSL